MKQKLSLLLAALLLVSALTACNAQTSAVSPFRKLRDDALTQSVGQAAQAFYDERQPVGLSVGVTTETNWIGQLALIFTMFFGRIGPVAFALSLSMRPKSPASRLRQEPEGKVWVA